MPVGIQVVGKKWEEEKVLAMMQVVDEALGKDRGFGPGSWDESIRMKVPWYSFEHTPNYYDILSTFSWDRYFVVSNPSTYIIPWAALLACPPFSVLSGYDVKIRVLVVQQSVPKPSCNLYRLENSPGKSPDHNRDGWGSPWMLSRRLHRDYTASTGR
jgi:hypothetical protein